jgi:uncharacterized protein
MITARIQQTEEYVRQTMAGTAVRDLTIGHDWKHVDRVRRWALAIAKEEGFTDLELVQAAALLHDIGLAHVEQRSQHAQVGAEVAAQFLGERDLFSEQERDAVVDAVRNHNALGDLHPLASLIRDADILDMLGAVGIMRAFTSKHDLPEYDLQNVKGETWGITARDVDRRFAESKGIGETIVDQINFQASCHDNLRTETARRLAAPLVAYMRGFLIQLESEIGVPLPSQ